MSSDRNANDHLYRESIRHANEQARMRQFMVPGKGHRVNFWRRVARAVFEGVDMIYVFALLQNPAAISALVYLVMNDHPWWAAVCILFICSVSKGER